MFNHNCQKHSIQCNRGLKMGSCHHGIAVPRATVGRDGLGTRAITANIMNKKSRTVENGWSWGLGVKWGLTKS
jgi:hypothetical protein